MTTDHNDPDSRSIVLHTAAHSLCFALWFLPSAIGVAMAREFAMSEIAFGVLVATPILVGSLARLPLGALADRYDSRGMMAVVMVAGAAAALGLSAAQSYTQALAASAAVGIAGGSFAVGVAFVANQFVDARAWRALDWLGSGIAGGALALIVAGTAHDWRLAAEFMALLLVTGAVVFVLLAAKTSHGNRNGSRNLLLQFAPLRKIQVLRFSLYYVFVFGGFVALIIWLPHYITQAYGADFNTAMLVAGAPALAGGLGRIHGGRLVEDYGARRVLYWTFLIVVAVTFILSYPATSYSVTTAGGDVVFRAEIGLIPFAVLVTLLALFLSFGQAAVYAHIPVYYPTEAAAVGAAVGMVGGLGGFVLPVMFAFLVEATGIYQSAFMLLFALVAVALLWMHLAIRRMERRAAAAIS